jgi:hypothetical protein
MIMRQQEETKSKETPGRRNFPGAFNGHLPDTPSHDFLQKVRGYVERFL